MYPDTPEFVYLTNLNEQQRAIFLSQYNANKKDSTAAILLTLFLGGVGAHRFYMGDTALGVIYLLFCWTLIPALIAFVEVFLISGRVRNHNFNLAAGLAAQVRALVPTTPIAPMQPTTSPTTI